MNIKLKEKIEKSKKLKAIAIAISGCFLLLFLLSSCSSSYGIDDLKGTWQPDVKKSFEIILDKKLKDTDQQPTPAQISMGEQALQQQIGQMTMSFSKNVVTTSIPPIPPIPQSFEVLSQEGNKIKIKTEDQKITVISFLSGDEIMISGNGQEQGMIFKRIN